MKLKRWGCGWTRLSTKVGTPNSPRDKIPGRNEESLEQFTDEEIFKEAGRRMRAKATSPPRAKVLRPCPKCGLEFGAREIKVHTPKCEGKK